MKLKTSLSAMALLAGLSGAYAAGPVESKASLSIDSKVSKVRHNAKTRMSLPAYAGNEEPTYITTVPESAEKKLYSRDWKGFWVLNYLISMIMQGEENQRVQYLYFDGDDVYYPTPVLSFEAPSYIKGKKTENGITFPLPQCVYSYTETESGTPELKSYYVDFLYWDLDFNNYYTADVAEEHSLDLTLEEDGTYRWVNDEIVSGPNPDNPEETLRFMKRVLGIVNQDEQWSGYADYLTVITPFTTPLVQVPEDAKTTMMTLTAGEVSRPVKVAYDKYNKVYIQGLSAENPESWVKGVHKDGVVTFKRQYVGIDADNYYFGTFSGAESEIGYNEILEQEELVVTPLETAVFNYDPETYTFTAETDVMIGGGADCEYAIEFLAMPVIKGRSQTMRPATPTIESWYNYNSDSGYGRVTFLIPPISETGAELDPAKLSWSFEIDGELYEWDPTKHKKFKEPMTWIPYDFTDGDDIVIKDNQRQAYFRKKVEHYLAIRLRYEKENGEYLESQYVLATTDDFNLEDWPSLGLPPAGDDEGGEEIGPGNEPDPDDPIEGVITVENNDSEIVAVQYYDLSGRRLKEAPAKGISLVRVIRADGTAKTFKIAR